MDDYRIPQEALVVLGAGTVNGQVYILPPTQLPRPLYEAVNKALVALGGKWDRKAKGHVFGEGIEVETALSDALTTGTATDRRREFNFFETPPELARGLIARAGMVSVSHVLEPSAGKGSIARAVREFYPGASFCCVELDPAHIHALQGMIAHDNPAVLQADFLSLQPHTLAPADLVAMNPPFSGGRDVAHVRHAYKFLNPGGRLVSVMSAAVLWREQNHYCAFRQWVETLAGDLQPLPEGSFRTSDTMVNTCVVTLDKPKG